MTGAGLVSLTLSQSFRRRARRAHAGAGLRPPARGQSGAGDLLRRRPATARSCSARRPTCSCSCAAATSRRSRSAARWRAATARSARPRRCAACSTRKSMPPRWRSAPMPCATTWRRSACPGRCACVARRRPMALATVVHAVDHLRGTLARGRRRLGRHRRDRRAGDGDRHAAQRGAGGDRRPRSRPARLVRRPGGRGARRTAPPGSARSCAPLPFATASPRCAPAATSWSAPIRRAKSSSRASRRSRSGAPSASPSMPTWKRALAGGAQRPTATEIDLPASGRVAGRRRSVRRRRRREPARARPCARSGSRADRSRRRRRSGRALARRGRSRLRRDRRCRGTRAASLGPRRRRDGAAARPARRLRAGRGNAVGVDAAVHGHALRHPGPGRTGRAGPRSTATRRRMVPLAARCVRCAGRPRSRRAAGGLLPRSGPSRC